MEDAMPKPNVEADADDLQRDADTGAPVGVAPNGAKTEGEIEEKTNADPGDAARIDPESRIPRPVQPDLA
jgi:hypothetical protein